MTGPLRKLVGRAFARGSADAGLEPYDRILLAIGKAESRAVRAARYDHLADAEFRIFSQFGDDGIIQHLIGRIPIENETFVEFGVADYRESNTRFLVCNDNWRGLIMDGGTSHVDFVQNDPIGWRHQVDARSVFITRENVNEVIADAGFEGDIGLLSVDIDGNDYWVLDRLSVVSPRILIVEYNSTFGPTAAVTVPYDPSFNRTAAHHSNLYWGASLQAIALAAGRLGHVFVGSNRAGNNAFFVRSDVLGDIEPVDVARGWVDARFRESRDVDGNLTFVGSRQERLSLIGHLPVIDVRTGERRMIHEAVSEVDSA